MRPVSTEFDINQAFGSMATTGVVGNIKRPNTVEYYVARYGDYQPFGHAGCDIACPEGTPVRAIADGTVLWADWGTNLPGDDSEAGYRRRWYLYKTFPGIVTVIQHDGWIGVYAHLSDAPLNPGDKVTEGQIIALSGGTGGVDPHLHVEALVDLSYRSTGGLIYGRTDPEPFFGTTSSISPQGTATPTTNPPEEETDMLTIFRDTSAADPDKTWIGNGLFKRHVADPQELSDLQLMAREGKLKIFDNGNVQVLPEGLFGVDLATLAVR